jgi:predicted glycogen debranching enzyme
MSVQFGREICGNFSVAAQREWLVTNGIGGYACGSVAGVLNRHYHGLLVAALKPPLARTLLLAKVDEQIGYGGQIWELACDRWADGTIQPQGYRFIEQFRLEGTVPVWTFACGDALLEKRIWMAQGENTTYLQYRLVRASQPFFLSLKAFVNYRDHHGNTQASNWQMQIHPHPSGVEVQAFEGAVPIYLLANPAQISLAHTWYRGYTLATEQYRGIYPHDDHLHGATFQAELRVGQSFTLVASTSASPTLDAGVALAQQHDYEQRLLNSWRSATGAPPLCPNGWISWCWRRINLWWTGPLSIFLAKPSSPGIPGLATGAEIP